MADFSPPGPQIEARFDWYQASIPTTADNILEAFLGVQGVVDFWDVKGVPQYDRSIGVFSVTKGQYDMLKQRVECEQTSPVAVISFGGNGGASPHVKATGRRAQLVSEVIRAEWPQHKVSRLDSCYDMSAPGLFDDLRKVMDGIHERAGVYRQTFGLGSPENGRTYYLGAPKSPMRVRCYEKGIQMGLGGHPDFQDWVRLEAQFRPRSADKARFATVTPEGVWSGSLWSRDLVGSALAKDPEPVKRAPIMERNEYEKLMWVLETYQKVFRDAGEDVVKDAVAAFFQDGLRGAARSLDHAASEPPFPVVH